MTHTFTKFTFAAALFGMLTAGGNVHGETLQDAVGYVLESHPDIKSYSYNRLAREQEVKQAWSGYLPQIDLMAGIGSDEVYEPFDDHLDPQQLTLSLRQNLFAGLSTKNEVERQEARVRSQAFLVQTMAEDTTLKTAKMYLDVLRSSELLELAKENLQIHERINDQIRLRSESGIDRRADMEQSSSRLALAESNVVLAETNLADARTNYLAVVGRLPEDLTKPQAKADLIPATMQDAVQMAVDGHPTLKSAEADLNARKAQDEVAKSPFMPLVDLEIDRNWSDDINYSTDEKENLIGMLRLRYNLFHGFKDKARKTETAYLISEAREIRNHTARQVVENIRLAWMAHSSTLNNIPYLERRVEASEITAKAYAKQWDIGRRALLDVLDAEAERITAKRDLLNTEYIGLYAQFRILNGLGSLVHSLGLEWPEAALVEENGQVANNETNTP